ncbi:hypothetical protein [Streptomyces sp. FH025]|uniref:hypothetical protein n=1 Tax=Streptomyces sp. FH025 TaxID=2815937 RepID=UPI001A9FB596|nr:hypothetical protein [Streptomyces sp. FH025]MBO1420467.1 hypothetical protein [Streptomyces sp. FH025]
MTPLGLHVATWWGILALAMGLYWVLLVPPMPTREYRWRTALAPVVVGIFAYLHYLVKHWEPATVLMMCTTLVLVFPLGIVGHRRKLARRLMEAKARGASEDEAMTPGVFYQMILAVGVMMTAFFVLKP